MTKKRVFLFVLLTLLVSAVALSACVSLPSENETNDGDSTVGRLVNLDEDGNGCTVSGTETSCSSVLMSDGGGALLSQSEIVNVVIFICFADESVTDARSTLDDSLISLFNGETQSLGDYYSELSYGAFSINTIFPYQDDQNTVFYVYRDAYARSYYTSNETENGINRWNPESTLLNNAVTAANEHLDYTGVNLDADGNGYVDSVSFVVNGTYNDPAYWGRIMWPHAWSLKDISANSTYKTSPSKLDGIYVDDYTFTFSERYNLGLISHEFGHLLGLPDYYHYDYDTDYLPVGYWDLMHFQCDIPQYVLTYTRYKYLGFASVSQIKEITENGVYTLSPTTQTASDGILAYKITLSDKESVWMEYRVKTDSSYDSELPASGLVIYRVNTSADGNEEAKHNSSTLPDEVYVYRPDCKTFGNTRTQEEYNLSYAALSASNQYYSSVGSATSTLKYNQNCIYSSDGTNTGIIISQTEEKNGSISFSVSLGEYENGNIEEAYVVGNDLDGADSKNNDYIYFGSAVNVSLYVKYKANPAAIEISDFETVYENKPCPEGQTAFAMFSDSDGEHKVPFTLYIYDTVDTEASVKTNPTKTKYALGDKLDLTGLSITVSYASGKIEIVSYSDDNAQDFAVVEGIDMSMRGLYNRIKIIYRGNVKFYLSGITVESAVKSIYVTEKDTLHIESDTQSIEFSVIARYADGTEGQLDAADFSYAFVTRNKYAKNEVKISLKTDESVFCATYAYIMADAKAVSATIEKTADNTVDFGCDPDFSAGRISVSFSNGFSINGDDCLHTENYYSPLAASYNPSKDGQQLLNTYLDGAKISAVVVVRAETDNILSPTDGNGENGGIIINNSNRTVIFDSDITLADFAKKISSYLSISYCDADGYPVAPNTHGTRFVGSGVKIILASSGGENIDVYTVYRTGDGDGDGLVTAADKSFWLDAFFGGAAINKAFDTNGDGVYTLTDFVVLNKKLTEDTQ